MACRHELHFRHWKPANSKFKVLGTGIIPCDRHTSGMSITCLHISPLSSQNAMGQFAVESDINFKLGDNYFELSCPMISNSKSSVSPAPVEFLVLQIRLNISTKSIKPIQATLLFLLRKFPMESS